MKLLIVGVFKPEYSTNEWMAQGFESLGHEVVRWDYRAAMARSRDLDAIEAMLKQIYRGRAYDFVIICKGDKWIIPLIRNLSEMYHTVLWWMDPKSTAKFSDAHQIASCCHRLICNNYAAMKWIQEHSFVPAHRIAEGYPDDIYFQDPSVQRKDVAVFVGNASRDRVKFLEVAIQASGGKIQVYGSGYSGSSINARPPIYGEQEAELYRSSASGINLCRDSGYSDRVCKMLACGLAVHTDDRYLIEFQDDFHGQRSLYRYRNRSSLIKGLTGESMPTIPLTVEGIDNPINKLTWKHQCEKIVEIMKSV